MPQRWRDCRSVFRGIAVAFAVALGLICAGCGGGESPEADAVAPAQIAPAPTPAPSPTPIPNQPTYSIRAGAYQLLGPLFNANVVVEASYYAIGQSFGLFFGCANTQTCLISDFQATPQQSAGKLVFPDRCRFPYVFAYQGATFLACNNSDPGDGDIYLYRSTDLVTWAIQNNGQPIVRRQPGTNWAHVWNVAILPVGNRWHMLAESHSTLGHMDIAYAWADPAVSMDFTPNQGPVVIPNGGNPEMMLLDGKMVAVHGLFRDRSATDPWYTTMSIADPSSPMSWTIRRDKLMIEQPGIDVCDPTYIEVNGQGRIAVSYDQNKVLELIGPPLAVN